VVIILVQLEITVFNYHLVVTVVVAMVLHFAELLETLAEIQLIGITQEVTQQQTLGVEVVVLDGADLEENIEQVMVALA
jgi:hypothetical protein